MGTKELYAVKSCLRSRSSLLEVWELHIAEREDMRMSIISSSGSCAGVHHHADANSGQMSSITGIVARSVQGRPELQTH